MVTFATKASKKETLFDPFTQCSTKLQSVNIKSLMLNLK